MATIETQQGDTFDLIAWRELGDCRHTEALMNVNREYIETQVFNAGVRLTLPTIEREAKEVLPPWKKQ